MLSVKTWRCVLVLDHISQEELQIEQIKVNYQITVQKGRKKIHCKRRKQVVSPQVRFAPGRFAPTLKSFRSTAIF